MVKKKTHYSETMVPGEVKPKKAHYSEEPKDPLESVIFKHLRPREESARKPRTFYVSDDNYEGVKKILGSRISEYVDDCLSQLLTMKQTLDEHSKGV